MHRPPLLVLMAAAVVLACAPPPDADAECATPADCAEPEPAPCEQCAPIATSVCSAGACSERGEDRVDVVIDTLLIDRDVDGVNGLVYAVVADVDCADALDGTALSARVSALASGQKTLTGGDLHEDVSLGRIPEGTVTVVALATAETAGQGAVLATGCAAHLAAAAPALHLERLDITP